MELKNDISTSTSAILQHFFNVLVRVSAKSSCQILNFLYVTPYSDTFIKFVYFMSLGLKMSINGISLHWPWLKLLGFFRTVYFRQTVWWTVRTRSAVNRRPASARSSATPCPRPSTSCSANSRPPSRPPSTSECASSSRTRAFRAMPRRRASTRGRREECCLAVLCFMFLKIIRKSQCAKIILFLQLRPEKSVKCTIYDVKVPFIIFCCRAFIPLEHTKKL